MPPKLLISLRKSSVKLPLYNASAFSTAINSNVLTSCNLLILSPSIHVSPVSGFIKISLKIELCFIYVCGSQKNSNTYAKEGTDKILFCRPRKVEAIAFVTVLPVLHRSIVG